MRKFIALLATASALMAAIYAASPAREKAFVDAYRGAFGKRMPKRCMPCSTAGALNSMALDTRCADRRLCATIMSIGSQRREGPPAP